MRSKIHAADRRLPKTIQSLKYSDERRKRDRINTLAQLNHDDDPPVEPAEAEIPPVFRPKEKEEMPDDAPQSPEISLQNECVRLAAANANLSGSTFRDVNLSNVKIDDANMTGLVLTDATLRGARLTNVGLKDVVIEDAVIDGLRINGISVADAFAVLAASR